jgi:cytochrome P450
VRRLDELDLPAFDHTDPKLGGDSWHIRITELARSGWLARTPMATVVLDRGASEEILRSKSAIFPGREVADLFEIDSGPLREEIDRNIININGKDHQRLRSLVAPYFTPKAAESHRPWVSDLFSGLLLAAMDSGEFEAVEGLCKPYASQVICELIGAPPEDASLLHDWSVWIQRQFDPIALATELTTLESKAAELQGWVKTLMKDKRKSPGSDLTSTLIAIDAEGDKLSETEVENLIMNVILGGIDTTQSQLAHAIRLFGEHPDQWQRLTENPTELVAAAAKEALRYEPVTPFTARLLTEDLEVSGVLFPAGTLLLVCSFMANRDPTCFSHPDLFSPSSRTGDEGRMLTFGAGIHYCLGANLATVELEEAIRSLAENVEHIELVPGGRFGNVSGIYSMDRLPVRLHPR